MSDQPVHPLTLYRLTLEMDDRSSFEYLKEFFKKKGGLWNKGLPKLLVLAKDSIIGVESRVRERLDE